MKSIWIPLALCASFAQLPGASAAQRGHDSNDQAIERAERDLAEAQARLEILRNKVEAPEIVWDTVEATDSPKLRRRSTPEVITDTVHLDDKGHTKGKFWSYGSDEKTKVKSQGIVKRVTAGERPNGITVSLDGASCEGVECESGGEGGQTFTRRGTHEVGFSDTEGLIEIHMESEGGHHGFGGGESSQSIMRFNVDGNDIDKIGRAHV